MRVLRLVSLAVLLVLPLALVSPAAANRDKFKHLRIRVHERGELFCPSSTLVFDDVIIQRGRCFVLSLLREPHGTFLAFAAPDAEIPRGQLVRLTTPAGIRLRERIFFLVPIRPSVVLVPVNTITLVPVRIEDFGTRVAIILIGTPRPNVTVIFNVRL